MQYSFHVYITTNPNKTVLYVGHTDDLPQRLVEHYMNRGKSKTFAGRYFCYNLLYFEEHQYVEDSLAREREIKGWKRAKKAALINELNPEWEFLNSEIMQWPPDELFIRGDQE